MVFRSNVAMIQMEKRERLNKRGPRSWRYSAFSLPGSLSPHTVVRTVSSKLLGVCYSLEYGSPNDIRSLKGEELMLLTEFRLCVCVCVGSLVHLCFAKHARPTPTTHTHLTLAIQLQCVNAIVTVTLIQSQSHGQLCNADSALGS